MNVGFNYIQFSDSYWKSFYLHPEGILFVWALNDVWSATTHMQWQEMKQLADARAAEWYKSWFQEQFRCELGLGYSYWGGSEHILLLSKYKAYAQQWTSYGLNDDDDDVSRFLVYFCSSVLENDFMEAFCSQHRRVHYEERKLVEADARKYSTSTKEKESKRSSWLRKLFYGLLT